MPDLNLTPLKCHNDAESYVTWLKNLGAHVPPTTLRYAGSMNPMEPPLKLKNFNGREANGSSCGPERPHRGGSSYVQLSAKLEKLNSPVRKYNALSIKRSVSVTTTTAAVTIPAHPEMMCKRSTRNVCKRHNCYKQEIVDYPSWHYPMCQNYHFLIQTHWISIGLRC